MAGPNMSRRTLVAATIGSLGVAHVAGAQESTPVSATEDAARPFPFPVEYEVQEIRPSHISQADMDSAILRHYQAWIRTYLRTDGGVGAWIDYDGSGATVSEAMGYGLVLAAYMNDRASFDALLAHVSAHPSSIGPNLMAWKQQLRDGAMVDVEGADSATDGDLDIAYGLLLADMQWGSAGVTNYRERALAVMNDILTYDVNRETMSLKVGDWATGDDARYTRSSDFMTGHFLAFARVDSTDAAAWEQIHESVASAANAVFANFTPETGLMPDFLVNANGEWQPVEGEWLESEHDGDAFWNACRTPWRLAMSWLTDGRRETIASQQTMSRWIRRSAGGEPANVMAGWYIMNGPEGEQIEDYADLAFLAPLAVNAMTGGDDAQDWLNRLWDAITGELYPEVTSYFGDAIRLHVLLTVSGNWWSR